MRVLQFLTRSFSVPSSRILFLRCVCLMVMVTVVLQRLAVQRWLDSTWQYLRTQPWYTTVYFETYFVTILYINLTWMDFVLHRIRMLDNYRILQQTRFGDYMTPWAFLMEGVVYVTPLALLDTFMVKRYPGASADEIEEMTHHWIQTRRVLPMEPPTLAGTCVQLLLSFLLYDAAFFFMHVAMHKNRWLYTNIHQHHHNHPKGLHIRVTNQLNIVERLIIVLTANGALKLVRSHPFTRTVFIPIFIGWLMESHIGYDFPWAYDKIIPFGLLGGATWHQEHHMSGMRHYEPFFTHLDRLVFGSKRKEARAESDDGKVE